MKLDPHSYPFYSGVACVKGHFVALKVTQEDFEQALNKPDLERAKDLAYHCHPYSKHQQISCLSRIVEKIVEIHKEGRDKEFIELNYTLDSARSLCCQMKTLADNDRFFNEQSRQIVEEMKQLVSSLKQH